MKKFNYVKGKKGESQAKDFLESIGFEFIEKNYRNDIGEIDLIMKENKWLVFVEVKYKTDDTKGRPEDMIDRRKLNQVKRTADLYLLSHKEIVENYRQYRIDAVCILGSVIKHYRNIYES